MLYELADLFRVFGDTTRIKILCALSVSDLCVADIAALLSMNQSAISHQLRVLKQAASCGSPGGGGLSIYGLDDDHVRTIFEQGFRHVRHIAPGRKNLMADGAGEIRLSLEGLNCAQCSSKIEKAVAVLPGVSSAAIDLVAGRMRISLEDQRPAGELLSSIRTVVSSIEPGVVVSEERLPEGPSSLPKGDMLRLSAGALLWLAALFLPLGETARFLLYVTAYLTAGIKVLRTVAGNLRRGALFDEFFLMTAATGGAFAIGEFSEAVAVMLFYETGELVQSLAVERSRRSILSLLDIRPDRATVLEDGEWKTARAEDVTAGRTLLVKPGERVPSTERCLMGRPPWIRPP